MKIQTALLTCLIAFNVPTAIAEKSVAPANVPTTMEGSATRPLTGTAPGPNAKFHPEELQAVETELPTAGLSKIIRGSFSETSMETRSAKDAQIYRVIAPSVVWIATNEGFGSGSLIDTSGDIITNWHVIKGAPLVAVRFKPAVEGGNPSPDDVKLGHVAKYDEISDLALVGVSDIPGARNPIRLGDLGEISVGADVHAIGHPTGEGWTYTKGVISQYRIGFEWTGDADGPKHKADVVQTQTPINPGNSGGPLISDSGTLIGVNSFKSPGEGLNFAVSISEVKKFLARSGNRVAESSKVAPSPKGTCEAKELFKSRNKENTATIIGYDINCSGKDNAEYVYPDKKSDPVLLKLDRNGDGKADVIFFDFKRTGKWDLSWWDENFDGHWTLVGYHDDGSLRPSRFESYEAYQRRLAKD
jgi:S1-C subfamily serine protease